MTDIQIKNVTELEKVDSIQDGDTLVVIRQNEDGTQSCYKADGFQFKGSDGKDAYTVAVANGFSGSYADWVQQIDKASSMGVSFDETTGEIIINS